MAAVGDIHNVGDQFTYQLQKLEDAIDDRDRTAIRGFTATRTPSVDWRPAPTAMTARTCTSPQSVPTRRWSTWTGRTWARLFEHEHQREMATGALCNYRKALQKFDF